MLADDTRYDSLPQKQGYIAARPVFHGKYSNVCVTRADDAENGTARRVWQKSGIHGHT